MKLGFSQSEIITTAKSLGLPTDGFIQRRVARAYDLVNTNKVSRIDDGIFRVRSQYEPDKSYIVNLNHGEPACNCPDGERTIFCKHRIASLLWTRKHEQAKMTIVKTTDGDKEDGWKRCWCIAQGNKRTLVYHERDRRLFCNCGAYYNDCEHKQLVIKAVKKERIVNECGSVEAKALQDKMNGQLDSRKDNNDGAGNNAPSQPTKLDISDPFQESEQLDIDQIEGRSNGELVHKLSNGEYVISYKGIMRLAEKHHITFETAIHSDTNTVIVKGRCERNERVSGKQINSNANTAIELAKRNAARQLLPLAEIKAIENYSEFDWKVAYQRCCDVASGVKNTTLKGKEIVDIIIHDLVGWGKLRQVAPHGC